MFASNHPNSLADAFVIGTSVSRKVNFVATVQLFKLPALRWLLSHCGVIPINRIKDDPRGMRSVLQTFEACFRVLEQGEAIAIFPEGITHDDPQLKELKSGTARMALELEQRHQGKLGLQIVPVGLTFSAKDVYRSHVLVNFGEPICVASFLPGSAEQKHRAIEALSAELETRIQGLIYHLPHLERARLVDAIKRLYLDKLWVANTVIHDPVPPQMGELLLTQAIASSVERAFTEHPVHVADFVAKLAHYERAFERWRLPQDALAMFPDGSIRLRPRMMLTALFAIVGAPVAAYGWLHRLLPYLLLRIVLKRSAKRPVDRTHVTTATVIGGLVLFTAFYTCYVMVFTKFFGWHAALWYALSLVPASLVAYYYVRELRRLAVLLRTLYILLRAPSVIRKLLVCRAELVALIDLERTELAGVSPTAPSA